jgi:hypothetical protein
MQHVFNAQMYPTTAVSGVAGAAYGPFKGGGMETMKAEERSRPVARVK